MSRQSAPFDVEVAFQTVHKCGVQLLPGATRGLGQLLGARDVLHDEGD